MTKPSIIINIVEEDMPKSGSRPQREQTNDEDTNKYHTILNIY